jgi:osmotically-inducible protein OsmY
VRIIVENGRLTLVGKVPNEGDSRTMGILAKGISGVFSVTNNLEVTRKL